MIIKYIYNTQSFNIVDIKIIFWNFAGINFVIFDVNFYSLIKQTKKNGLIFIY